MKSEMFCSYDVGQNQRKAFVCSGKALIKVVQDKSNNTEKNAYVFFLFFFFFQIL